MPIGGPVEAMDYIAAEAKEIGLDPLRTIDDIIAKGLLEKLSRRIESDGECTVTEIESSKSLKKRIRDYLTL